MNTARASLFGIGLSMLAVSSIRAQADLIEVQPAAMPSSSQPSAADLQFVTTAAKASAQECADARLAVMMTRREDVKELSEMLFQDHTHAAEALTTLVVAKGWAPPPSTQLTNGPGANGTYTDAQYLAEQISAHKNAIVLFDAQVSHGEDVDLRAYAKATLPNLKHHLVMLQVLSNGSNVSS